MNENDIDKYNKVIAKNFKELKILKNDIETKLNEADMQAKELKNRLTHKKVFNSIRIKIEK